MEMHFFFGWYRYIPGCGARVTKSETKREEHDLCRVWQVIQSPSSGNYDVLAGSLDAYRTRIGSCP